MNSECLEALTSYLQPIGITFLLAAVGSKVLHLVYKSVQTNWPESYTSISTDFDQQVRTNPLRSVVLFRGGPVFLIALFIAVLLERYGGFPWSGATLLIIIYLAFTTVKAIWETVGHPRPPHWTVLVLYHLTAALVVILAVLFATALRKPLEGFIPPTKDLLIALWAGLFAGIFAATARTLLSAPKLSKVEIIEQLRADAGSDTWNYISEVSNTDSELRDLLRALVLAEVQQRPRWFRRLERVKGIFYGPGTYGVAQVSSPKPINDQKSIELLAKRFSTYSIPKHYGEYPDYQKLRKDLLAHNPDGTHADRIIEFYQALTE